MRHQIGLVSLGSLAFLLAATAPAPALAQDPPAAATEVAVPRAWSDTAELAYVLTSGNSQSSTLGFKDTLTWKVAPSTFELKVGGVTVETTTVDRVVVAGPAVSELETTSKTAENYFMTGRYDHALSPKSFWFAGGGWERNRPAGLDSRYSAVGGVGNIWRDSDHTKFRTDYALTYTKQDDVAPNPVVDDTFAGLRLSWKYEHKFNEATTYGNETALDENLEETSDWRGDMINWMTVAMTRRVALKVSLRWQYDNEPSFTNIADPLDLLPPAGPTAFYQLDNLDTIFTTALVINI